MFGLKALPLAEPCGASNRNDRLRLLRGRVGRQLRVRRAVSGLRVRRILDAVFEQQLQCGQSRVVIVLHLRDFGTQGGDLGIGPGCRGGMTRGRREEDDKTSAGQC